MATSHPQAAVLALEDLSVGLARELRWTVTAEEIEAFARLSGDFNPLHVDADFARHQGFEDRVSHGVLLSAKVSAFAGMVLPGRDCLLLEMHMAWPNVVLPGDSVLIRGEIAEISLEQRVTRIRVKATKQGSGKAITVGRGSILCQIRS